MRISVFSFLLQESKKEGGRVPAGKRYLPLFCMDLEQKAIERVKMASEMSLRLYGRHLVVTDSGGKDSAVCREIVRRAGIPFEIHHNLTIADAPQTIYYVRNTFRKLELEGVPCFVNYPIYKGQRVTMWTLIPMKSSHLRGSSGIAVRCSKRTPAGIGLLPPACAGPKV